MASSIPSTSSQTMATGSSSLLIDEEDERGYKTDLSTETTDTEVNQDMSKWSEGERKLQHMNEFHAKYQHVFGEGAFIRMIMKRRICNMNPPMPKIVCKDEMQNAILDDEEVIIEYITDAQGNRVKKLKPVFIKSEPDRDHTLHVNSDDNLLDVPEENFTKERERTADSYSESIASDDEPSDERTMTADSDSSKAAVFEETMIGWDVDPKGLEATLHQISTGLKNAVDGYLALASHITCVAPYKLPQDFTQIPPPPMDVPIPIMKASSIDGESTTVSYLIHGEYELADTSWSKLQEKYQVSRNKVFTAVKGKKRPGGSQYWQKSKKKRQTKEMSDITKMETEKTKTTL